MWSGGEYWEGINKQSVTEAQKYLPADLSIYVKHYKKKHNNKMFLVLAAILALVSVPTPSASQEDSTALPLALPARVISTNEQDVCPPSEMVRNETVHDVRNMIRNTIIPTLCDLGQTQASPAASCSALHAYCPSKYYWVRSSNGTAVQIYCEMDRVCR